MTSQAKEPIAIIGIACRLPGNIASSRDLWSFLERGGDGTVAVPKRRWNHARFHQRGSSQPGKITFDRAGFIDGVADFDAEFFGFPDRAAAETDPHHRMLLTVTWEALEDAGLVPEELAGTPVGVFVGISSFDYAVMQNSELSAIGPYSRSSTSHYMGPNGVSYYFDFTGPSVAVDAACSSSLLALDMACQNIWHGRCDMAVVGGSNLLLSPQASVSFSQLGSLSPDGQCKPFDARANGYARSEGVVATVLKPLGRARADRDPIYAVIRASVTNHGGHNDQGWTVPSRTAQTRLLHQAYRDADIESADIAYIEAHGTGTIVGDRIEAAAIGAFVKSDPHRTEPLVIGSVKSNLGHGEASAGLIGLCKVAVMLKEGKIPPSIHFETPNPEIPFDELNLRVPRALEVYERADTPMVAGVSSFGIGGSNAHVVLQALAPTPMPDERVTEAPATEREPVLLPFSAHTPQALELRLERHLHFLDALETPAPGLTDIAHTLGARRTHHEYRTAFVAATRDDLKSQLRARVDSPEPPASKSAKLAFVFSGMGPQWWGMGRELMARKSVFRDSLTAFDDLWRRRASWSLVNEMRASEQKSRIGRDTEVSMTANIGLQIALAALWRHLGIVPDIIVGHSVGEVAAAHAAGAISLEQAVAIAHARVRSLSLVVGTGTMAAIGLPVADVEPYLASHRGSVTIAAVNSPHSLTISGDVAAIEQVLTAIGEDIFARRLQVDVPFHSQSLRAHHDAFAAIYPDIAPQRPAIRYVSSVTGTSHDGPLDKPYWLRNFEHPVWFSDAISHIVELGCTTFLEVGPHPVLGYSIGECLRECGVADSEVVSSLRKREPERRHILGALARLYARGATPTWSHLISARARCVQLPTYPWQQREHWVESTVSRHLRFDDLKHPLVGSRQPLERRDRRVLFAGTLYPNLIPYLQHHRIDGRYLLPGAAYVEMALTALSRAPSGATREFRDVTFEQALEIPSTGTPVHMQLVADLIEGRFDIQACPDDGDSDWRMLASGSFVDSHPDQSISVDSIDAAQARCSVELERDEYYQQKWLAGYEFGTSFKTLKRIRLSPDGTECVSDVALPVELRADRTPYHSHPVLLDAAFQTASVARSVRKKSELLLPVGVARVRVHEPLPAEFRVHARLTDDIGPTSRYTLTFFGDTGDVLLEFAGYTCKAIPRVHGGFPWNTRDWLYRETWSPQELAEPAPVAGHSVMTDYWLILAGSGEPSKRLAYALAARLAERSTASKIALPRHAGCDEPLDDSPVHRSVQVELLSIEARGAYGVEAPGEYGGEMAVDNRADIARLLETLNHRSSACRGIVYLGNLDCDDPPADENQALDVAVHVCSELASLLQALESSRFLSRSNSDHTRLYLVSRRGCVVADGEQPALLQTPMWGMGRVVMSEHPELSCSLVDLDESDDAAASLVLARELAARSAESEVAWRDNRRFACRIARYRDAESAREELPAQVKCGAYRVAFDRPGRFDNLYLRELIERPPGPGQVQIRVHTAALNFRDVMKVMGIYPTAEDDANDALILGDECAGTVVAVGDGVESIRIGDAVIARHAGSCLASLVTVPGDYVFPVPTGMALAEAATVPVVFSTVYFALAELARVRAGESVLIHSATGGVGLAAIQYAQHVGARVLATAGNPDKRAYLRSLGIECVMDSRSLVFADQVLQATEQRGVDVVLNSLTGAAIPRTLSVMAPFGRFLEIGKRDIYDGTEISLRAFRKNLSYHAIDLAEVWRDRPDLARTSFQAVLQLIEQGALKALPRTDFPVTDVASAFRFMAQARHIGKVAIHFEAPGQLVVRNPRRQTMSELVGPDGAYLITGGLGGFGIAMAHWLVRSGARYLVLMSRTGASTPRRRAALEALERAGARVIVARGCVERREDVSAIVRDLDESGVALRGILHLAGTLSDTVINKMEPSHFRDVMAPKIAGAWNLHQLTRARPLRFFVLFSSAAVVDGNPGQANYVAANRFLDALAHYRRARGLVGSSINWGVLSDVGMSAESDLLERFARSGTYAFTPDEATRLCTEFFESDVTQITVLARDWARYASAHQSAVIPGRLTALVETTGAGDVPASERASLRSLAGRLTLTQLNARVLAELCPAVARIAGVRADRLTDNSTFDEIGADSLMTIELANWLRYELGLNLGQAEIKSAASIGGLTRVVSRELRSLAGLSQSAAPPERAGTAAPAGATIPLVPFQIEAIRLLEESAIDGALPAWFSPLAFEVQRPLDLERAQAAFEAIVARHDALRIHFEKTGDGWRQLMGAAQDIAPIGSVDLTSTPVEQRNGAVDELARQLFFDSCDLSRSTLIRALSISHATDTHDLLFFGIHHMISDLASIGIFRREFFRAYHQLSMNQPIALPAVTGSFTNWAHWCDQQQQRAADADEVAFWQHAKESDIASLPAAVNADEVGLATDRIELLSPAERSAFDRAAAEYYQASPADVLYAVIFQAMKRWLGGPIRVLLPHAGRLVCAPEGGDLANVIGPFPLPAMTATITDDTATPLASVRAVQENLRTARAYALRSLKHVTSPAEVVLNWSTSVPAEPRLPDGFSGPALIRPISTRRWRGPISLHKRVLRCFASVPPGAGVTLSVQSKNVDRDRLSELLAMLRADMKEFNPPSG